jgi:hopanoid biosynthesis associated RND transporter like protein HpnN
MHSRKKNKWLFGFISRHARSILMVSLLLSGLSLFYTSQKMEFLTGRDDLMPKNTRFHGDYRAYRNEFGDKDDIVVVMESDDQEKVGRFGEMLYQRLSADRKYFSDVFYPYGLAFFRENGLLYMPLSDLQALRDNIARAKPVLKELSVSPSVSTLFSSLTSQIDAYVKQGSHTGENDKQLASLVFMLDKLGKGFEQFGKNGPAAFSLDEFLMQTGPEGKESSFSGAGKMQILTVLPFREGKSFVPAEAAIKKIRKEIKDLSGMPEFKGVKVGLTGIPVLEYEEMTTSKHDISLATVISVVLTVILLLFAFRGVMNVLAAMASLLIALSLSFGLATLLVGHLNILSMVFAVMLIGIGIEYGIQVVLRYQEEILRGTGELDALRIGVEKNFWSIIMAAATSACAFLTFIFTDFKGIAELGIIAGCGIAVCVVATFTVLPAILVIFSRYRKPAVRTKPAVEQSKVAESPDGGQGKGRLWLTHALFGHPKVVIGTTIILCLASIYPLLHVKFDYNLMNLQAKGLESVEYAYKLMRNTDNPGYYAVAMASSAADAAAKTRALEELATVDRVVSFNSLVPEDQSRKLAMIADIRNELSDVKPVPYEENLQVMELPVVFENFRNSVVGLAGRLEEEKKPEAARVKTFLATLDGFFARLEKEKDSGALNVLRDFQGNMLASLPQKLGMLKASLNPVAVTTADIPSELKNRFVGKTGKYLLQVVPKQNIFDFGPLKAFLDDVRKVDIHATGEPVMVYESMTIMRDAYRGAFIYAFIAITVLLLITFRSVRAAVIGLVPLIVGILLMISGMWLFGINFNSANIIVLPLVLGIAVDSGIYIINRFRREGETSVQVVSRSAGRGVIFNTFTIMATFGALMVSHHRGVFSIGAVMSLGMAACQVAFILVLPAVLTVYADRYRKKLPKDGD